MLQWTINQITDIGRHFLVSSYLPKAIFRFGKA
jgi:hypothetical protein